MKNKNLWLSYKMFLFKRSQKKMYSFFHFLIRSGYDFNFIQHERWKKKLIGAQAPLEYHKPAKSLAQMLLEGF